MHILSTLIFSTSRPRYQHQRHNDQKSSLPFSRPHFSFLITGISPIPDWNIDNPLTLSCHKTSFYLSCVFLHVSTKSQPLIRLPNISLFHRNLLTQTWANRRFIMFFVVICASSQTTLHQRQVLETGFSTEFHSTPRSRHRTTIVWLHHSRSPPLFSHVPTFLCFLVCFSTYSPQYCATLSYYFLAMGLTMNCMLGVSRAGLHVLNIFYYIIVVVDLVKTCSLWLVPLMANLDLTGVASSCSVAAADRRWQPEYDILVGPCQ